MKVWFVDCFGLFSYHLDFNKVKTYVLDEAKNRGWTLLETTQDPTSERCKMLFKWRNARFNIYIVSSTVDLNLIAGLFKTRDFDVITAREFHEIK